MKNLKKSKTFIKRITKVIRLVKLKGHNELSQFEMNFNIHLTRSTCFNYFEEMKGKGQIY